MDGDLVVVVAFVDGIASSVSAPTVSPRVRSSTGNNKDGDGDDVMVAGRRMWLLYATQRNTTHDNPSTNCHHFTNE